MNFIGKSLLLEEKGKKVLILGDLHLGFEQSIHAAGIATSSVQETCVELEHIFAQIGNVETCVLLGDVIHHFRDIPHETWKGIRNVFSLLMQHASSVVLIRGNHDVLLRQLLHEFPLSLVSSWTWNGYCCVHGDRDLPDLHAPDVHTWILGHGHPAYRLEEGAKRELYKCFLVGTYKGKKIVLVPSFFEGSPGTDVSKYPLPYPWPFHLARFTFYLIGEDRETRHFGKLLAKNL